MKFVLFKDVLEERSAPQYGIVGDGENPDVTCLCCGGTVEYGDYEVIRIIPWTDAAAMFKPGKYVVCMDSYGVRDAQMIDVSDVEDINDINTFSDDQDERWKDMEPNPFIAVVEAASEDDACRIAAAQYRYDHRCLYAQKI